VSAADDLYARAGIDDVAAFYRTKFVSDAVLDHRYFKALDRFNLRFARTMWVYDNVRRGAAVLDLGCGAGMLALLKRKDVTLVGVDLSDECAAAAKRNGYDETVQAPLHALPFADQQFDYVISLDVIGHITFAEKDAVLAEIKRVLRPGGVTLHGIECTDRAGRRSYDEMDREQLREFIAIDGHVGLEEEQEHAQRFRRFFKHVAQEPRYALCLSSEEFIKQADEYGLPFESDFVDYLRQLTFSERRAFDMAMGYVFGKISDLHVRLPRAGLYTFLKASDAPLGPFYNEHRDRTTLLELGSVTPADGAVCLDRHPFATFDDGWYEPDDLPPRARWMRRSAHVQFHAAAVRQIELDLTTHIPDVAQHGLGVEVLLNGARVCAFTLIRHGWLELQISLGDEVRRNGTFALEFRTSRTWQPRPGTGATRDDRELSIAVCNLRIR
jgi:ubiquinone/menaquinone biosynthesis C-methylase UbiE